jgi:hypothetical protein
MDTPDQGPPFPDRDATLRALDWAEMYRRLAADRRDAPALAALGSWVSLWAYRGLFHFGPDVIEQVIAETCRQAVANFQRARGAETFSGFVYGHYLDVRRRRLRPDRPPVNFDAPSRVPDETVLREAEAIAARRWAEMDLVVAPSSSEGMSS